jgi:hypothetical protein
VLEEARKQTDLALRQEMSDVARLQSVFWPMAKAASGLCADRAAGSLGALPGSLLFIPEAIRPQVRALTGMDERLTFTEIVASSPAQLAGIMPGDVLTHLDGKPLPVSREANRVYQTTLDAAVKKKESVGLTLERKGQALQLRVTPEPVCATTAIPMPGDQVTAFAGGRVILVTRGMLRFATDAELAVVVGHELAHIALGHTVPASAPSAPVAASSLTPQQKELDADTVGLYLAAAAGLPYADAAAFWRRIAAQYPSTIQGSHTRSHPASPERFIELDKAASTISSLLARPGTEAITVGLRDGKSTAPIPMTRGSGAVSVSWLGGQYTSRLAPVATAPSQPSQPSASPPAAVASLLASAVDPGTIPNLDAQGREGYKEFLTKVSPRAFALSTNGMWSSAWGGQDPSARALSRCAQKGGVQCRLFALNNEVVWQAWVDSRSGEQ